MSGLQPWQLQATTDWGVVDVVMEPQQQSQSKTGAAAEGSSHDAVRLEFAAATKSAGRNGESHTNGVLLEDQLISNGMSKHFAYTFDATSATCNTSLFYDEQPRLSSRSPAGLCRTDDVVPPVGFDSTSMTVDCDSVLVSSEALLKDLQSRRKLLRQSLDDAFDAMLEDVRRHLEPPQAPRTSGGDGTPSFGGGGARQSLLSISTAITDAAGYEGANEKAVDDAPSKSKGDDESDGSMHDLDLGNVRSLVKKVASGNADALHRKTTDGGNKRLACIVSSEADHQEWSRFATKMQEVGGYNKRAHKNIFKRAVHGLKVLTEHRLFELAFAALIVVHTVAMAVETQYHSWDVCYDIGFPACTRPAEKVWPSGTAILWTLEMAFGVVFTIEVSLKMMCKGFRFFASAWNFVDLLIITSWFIVVLSGETTVLNPMLVRLARVARLLRFLRLVKTVQMFDVLRLLIGSLNASGAVLLWSGTLLLLIMVCAALLSHNVFLSYIFDETLPEETRHLTYQVFGSFSRAFLSVYQLTFSLDTEAPQIIFELNELFAIPLICYQGVVSFAVIKVIEAVFLNETIKVAASNEELMIMERNRSETKQAAKIEALFDEADFSRDGLMDQAEFMLAVNDDRVKTLLDAMDLEFDDPKMVWDLLCGLQQRGHHHGGDTRQLSRHWFVKGIKRLKGSAKSLDVLVLLRDIECLASRVRDLEGSRLS
eukprot:TRINITY_DN4249_c0_g1_i2.p1 TRINITY_DN4249_c0_g1~~TRINITY_DN4249_c0_g1_i2.p1  ORF type:complete len:710 (+),score=200.42 TRINITY_DN4249_c0_g1_i2:81-2210(+)